MGILFILDCITPLGYAVWLGYVASLIATIWVNGRNTPWWVASLGTPLIVIGFFASPAGISPVVDLVNRSLVLSLLWITAACLTVAQHNRSSMNALSPYRLQSSIVTTILMPTVTLALVSAFMFWQWYQVIPKESFVELFGRSAVPALIVVGTAVALIVSRRILIISSRYSMALLNKERAENRLQSLTKELEQLGKERSGDHTCRAVPSKMPSTAATHPQNERIPVLLVDDHAMVRQGLRSVMEAYADIEIVGEASNGQEAVKLVERRRPAVVLMDINMPKLNGIEATAKIKHDYPHVSIIGLSVNAESHNQEAMRQAGAALLLPKEAVIEELHNAIHSVLREPT